MSLLGLFLVLVPLGLLASRQARDRRTLIPANVDSFYLPSPGALHVLSLRNDRMLADLIWIKTLMYFGEEITGRARQTWLYSYLDTVLRLDRKFERAWEWGGSAMIYNGRVIDDQSIHASIELYERGLRQFPDNWKMAASLGFNYAYELNPRDKATRSANRKKAITWFLKAARHPDSPPYIKQFALSQMSREGMRLMAVTFLKEAYAKARNDRERAALEKRMRELLSQKDAALWKKWQREYEVGKERDLPYGSKELYYNLGFRDGAPPPEVSPTSK